VARWREADFIVRELRPLLTDDFVRVDHRRLVGVPGAVGPDEYVEQQLSFAEPGTERPTPQLLGVLGTRGNRCIATRSRLVYPNGTASDMITVRAFDAAVERCARLVIFDADDIESALVELDRLHAEVEADVTPPTVDQPPIGAPRGRTSET
jgi:hypothetical protein